MSNKLPNESTRPMPPVIRKGTVVAWIAEHKAALLANHGIKSELIESFLTSIHLDKIALNFKKNNEPVLKKVVTVADAYANAVSRGILNADFTLADNILALVPPPMEDMQHDMDIEELSAQRQDSLKQPYQLNINISKASSHELKDIAILVLEKYKQALSKPLNPHLPEHDPRRHPFRRCES